jgi:hypothetical protein
MSLYQAPPTETDPFLSASGRFFASEILFYAPSLETRPVLYQWGGWFTAFVDVSIQERRS